MILVTGANGQLGTELRYLLDERNEDYVAVDVAEMDITDADKVEEVFSQVKPTLVNTTPLPLPGNPSRRRFISPQTTCRICFRKRAQWVSMNT